MLDLIRMIYFEGNPTGIKVLMETLGLCENNLRLHLFLAQRVDPRTERRVKKGYAHLTPQSLTNLRALSFELLIKTVNNLLISRHV